MAENKNWTTTTYHDTFTVALSRLPYVAMSDCDTLTIQNIYVLEYF